MKPYVTERFQQDKKRTNRITEDFRPLEERICKQLFNQMLSVKRGVDHLKIKGGGQQATTNLD